MEVLRARFRAGGDSGSAIVEFLGVTLLLLVPIVYLVVAVAQVQAAVFAAEGGAREAGRIVARTAQLERGEAVAVRAVELAFRDQGLDVDGSEALRLSCQADPCLTPGALIHVEVATTVPLPLVPDVLARVLPAEVPVSASHAAVVPRFRVPAEGEGAA